jgi:phospholipid/cholesterol/gamma-HCH transport system substrate-binding protein
VTGAIRKHFKAVIAIVVLVALGVGTTWVILQEQRLRIPVLEERPFEFKAEFADAGAVVPGQGQTLRVAGVRIGDVQDVDLEEGVAVVTFVVDREFLPIYRDATMLVRPTTGLEDMFFQLDPGTRRAGEIEEGEVLPVTNTAPDVELHEILEALDADTQAYLRLLLVGAGRGLDGRARDLGQLLGSLGPINRDLERLNRTVAGRQENLARLIHNLNVLTGRVGQAEDDLAELVGTSNAALGAIAEQDPDVRRAVALLPGTLSRARETLNEVASFAEVLGPTFNDLRPFARNLPALNSSTRELAEAATPVLESEIRPFVRSAREPIPALEVAARRFATATPSLAVAGRKLNRAFNLAAYNPNGAEPPGAPGRDEGYLYWTGWLSHVGNLVFSTQDAHGNFRRVYFTASCNTVRSSVAEDPTGGVVSGLIQLVTPGAICDPAATP